MTPYERKQLSNDLARLADGERAAFDPVFDLLWPILRRFAVRLLQDESAGEDVAQQALLKLFARAHEYDCERDALAWALGITTWECRSWRRKRSRRRESAMDGPPEGTDPTVDPEQRTIARDLESTLMATLGDLSARDREVLLADLHGAAHGARPATIRKRRQRAIERLRAAWKVMHGTE